MGRFTEHANRAFKPNRNFFVSLGITVQGTVYGGVTVPVEAKTKKQAEARAIDGVQKSLGLVVRRTKMLSKKDEQRIIKLSQEKSNANEQSKQSDPDRESRDGSGNKNT